MANIARRPCFNSASLIFLISASVLPVLKPAGSKNPVGAMASARPSVDFFKDDDLTVLMEAGAKEAAPETRTRIAVILIKDIRHRVSC